MAKKKITETEIEKSGFHLEWKHVALVGIFIVFIVSLFLINPLLLSGGNADSAMQMLLLKKGYAFEMECSLDELDLLYNQTYEFDTKNYTEFTPSGIQYKRSEKRLKEIPHILTFNGIKGLNCKIKGELS